METEKQTSSEPTTREVESHQFELNFVDREFTEAFNAAMERVKKNEATVRTDYKDGIQDAAHMKHITVTNLKGEIIYDQDFRPEEGVVKQIDKDDN